MTNSIEAKFKEREEELRHHREHWKANKAFFQPIVDKLIGLNIEPYYDSSLNIHFTGDKHKLAAVVRILRTGGMISQTDPPTANASSWWAYFRTQDYSKECYINFSSSVCRRVKTGTKMVQQDVYETVCGESDPQNTATLV